MSNFGDCILVKMAPSEPYFVALTTYDIYHGRSIRFLLRKTDLAAMVSDHDTKRVIDTDIGSYIEISRRVKRLHFKLVILHQDYRNDVTGYVHCFELPTEKVNAVLNGRNIHHVEYVTDGQPKAQLLFTDSSHLQIRELCHDKLMKHALRKFFRDHFNYGREERIRICPDCWVNGFYFECDGLNGGIARHEETVTGKNGREYKKVFYAMHT